MMQVASPPNADSPRGRLIASCAQRPNLAGQLESFLKQPGMQSEDINYRTINGTTPLMMACISGNQIAVKLLLRHPLVLVALPTMTGYTALHFAASCRSSAQAWPILRLLCDHRGADEVDINCLTEDNTSPLWLACLENRVPSVSFILAYFAVGRLQLGVKSSSQGNEDVLWIGKTALEVARGDTRKLIQRYVDDPLRTRNELRLELGFVAEDVALDFAAGVLLSDHFLLLRHHITDCDHRAQRFWAILRMLPMELQMLLCHRRQSSPKQTVLKKHLESALHTLIASLV